MLRMWYVWDVKCSRCGMFGIWGVQNVGCSGCETFKMWDVGNLGFWGKNVAVCWHQLLKKLYQNKSFLIQEPTHAILRNS